MDFNSYTAIVGQSHSEPVSEALDGVLNILKEDEEISSLLKTLTTFLKGWNISSPDYALVPFVSQILSKIDSLEEEDRIRQKIDQSTKMNDKITKSNNFMKRGIEYNNKIVQLKKANFLESKSGSKPLESQNEIHIPLKETHVLEFERINKLLDVLDAQEEEITWLTARIRELSS